MPKGILFIIGGFLVLGAAAVLAQQVGGIAARVGAGGTVDMEISEPVVLGVPTRVDWSRYSGSEGGALLEVRTQEGAEEIWRGSIATRQAFVVFPCSVEAPASVDLRDTVSGALLAHKRLQLFKAGEDCF